MIEFIQIFLVAIGIMLVVFVSITALLFLILVWTKFVVEPLWELFFTETSYRGIPPPPVRHTPPPERRP